MELTNISPVPEDVGRACLLHHLELHHPAEPSADNVMHVYYLRLTEATEVTLHLIVQCDSARGVLAGFCVFNCILLEAVESLLLDLQAAPELLCVPVPQNLARVFAETADLCLTC